MQFWIFCLALPSVQVQIRDSLIPSSTNCAEPGTEAYDIRIYKLFQFAALPLFIYEFFDQFKIDFSPIKIELYVKEIQLYIILFRNFLQYLKYFDIFPTK